MAMTDPISDLLTRIRNANLRGHEQVEFPFSRIKFEISKILRSEGYISDIKEIKQKNKKNLRLFLKYYDKKTPVIEGLKRISKPGRRVYSGYRDVPKVQGGMGIAIISTPKGLLTDKDCRALEVGGEILCHVW